MTLPPPADLRNLFQLDFSVHFLNHGSFGACPIPVFEVYQDWQRRLERQPVLFLGRELARLNFEARTVLADYLKAAPDSLVFVPNVTHGVNIIARSLDLNPGDEILTTDHEYGACDYTWEFILNQRGATYKRQPVRLPASSPEEIVEQLWEGVTPRTRLIYLSHISSPTALRLPVETICQRARQAGILTLVDGAHAPGQINLDLPAIGADFYTGNCHKWMLSPKGAGFLYAHQAVQSMIQPLVVSWGYHATPETSAGSPFLDNFGWSGTQDPAACLAVPAAIQFMHAHEWGKVRQVCQALLRQAIQQICELVEMEPLYPLNSDFYQQMAIAPLPAQVEIAALQKQLYEKYRVEVPLIEWNGRIFVRISVQGYNTPQDLEALLEGLKALLPG